MQPVERLEVRHGETELAFSNLSLGLDDAQAYMDFDQEVYFNSETPSDHTPPYFEREEVTGAMEEGDIFGALIDEDGRWIATYWLSPMPNEKALYISNLVVRKDHRDKGIGATLLDYAEQIAQERGFEKCTLSVDPLNARGISLYFRHGYQIVSHVGDNNPYGLKKWVNMEKSLNGQQDEWDGNPKYVHTGDDTSLRQLLDDGWIGRSIIKSPTDDPYMNTIELAKPITPRATIT